MGETTSVILITGFLGSGKTTFLNRVIDNFPKDLKLTILMNEFGEIGIDGTLVEGDDIDMLEISRGSIFCVCVKTDFIKGLYELSTKIRPDLLIIESTGVANPADLKRDLMLPIFDNRFKFVEQFCIIDAAHFLDAFEVFASVEKQLSTSTVFIINKTDQSDKETIRKIKKVIEEHHPAPQIFETNFSDIPLDVFPSLMIPDRETQGYTIDPQQEGLSIEKLDHFISTILENPELETTPPDQLASVTYSWLGNNLDEIRQMAQKLPPSIVRAKGFVQPGDTTHLFNYVMGDWTLKPYPGEKFKAKSITHINKIVFIGDISAINNLHMTLNGPHWTSSEILQPFGQISQM